MRRRRIFFVLVTQILISVKFSSALSFGDDGPLDFTQLDYEVTLGKGIGDAKTAAHISPIRRAIHTIHPSFPEARSAVTAYHWRPSHNYPAHVPVAPPKHYHGHSHNTAYDYHHPKPHKPVVIPVPYTPSAYPEFPIATAAPGAGFPIYVPKKVHHSVEEDAGYGVNGGKNSGGDREEDNEEEEDSSSERPKQPRDYFPPPSLIGVLEDEEATTFLSLLERADLLETLEGEGPFTVFAPSNDAFSNMNQDTIDSLTNDDDLLKQVLTYHIVPAGKISTRIVKDELQAPTLEGTDIRFTKSDEEGEEYITVNGAELDGEKSDQRAANGIVHFMNEVIYPVPAGSIYDTLDDDSRFVTLIRALNIAELIDTLDDDGPYTIFAPTDDAFDNISEEALNDLLDDKEALTKVLLKHVVSGTKLSRDLTFVELEGVTGEKLKVRTKKGKVFVNDASIVDGDIIATNGAIQVIDKVLL